MAVTPRLKDSLLGAAGLARSTGRLLRRTATPAARQAVTFLRSRLATESPAAEQTPPADAGGSASAPASSAAPASAPASAPTSTPASGAEKKRTTTKPPSPADVAPRVHPHPPEHQTEGDRPPADEKPAAKRPKPTAPGAKLPPRKPGSTGD